MTIEVLKKKSARVLVDCILAAIVSTIKYYKQKKNGCKARMDHENIMQSKDCNLICVPSVQSVGQQECKGSCQVTITSTNSVHCRQ